MPTRIAKIASISLLAFMAPSTFAQDIVPVEQPVEACPAFDVVRQNALDYARGNISAEAGEASGGQNSVAVEFILDASGSMAGQVGGEIKMEVARNAFTSAIAELDDTSAMTALRAYGFDDSVDKTPEASCPNTQLLTGFGATQSDALIETAHGLAPYGYTPIAASLMAAGDDLSGLEADHRLIVLLSDGEETCGGDPVDAARELVERDLALSTFVVGFDLAAEQASQMRAIAEAGGGRYLDAPDAQSLQEMMREIINVTVSSTRREIERCENPVQGGLTPEDATLIEPGIYTLGELIEQNEYRYYRIASREGELATIHGLVQAWRYIEVDGEDARSEGQHGLASMTMRILDMDGNRAGSRDPRLVGRPGETGTGYYMDTDGRGFLIGIGDNYEHVNPYALISIELNEAMDGALGSDADDVNDGELAALSAGDSAIGYLGYDDVADRWRIGPDGPREASHMSVSLIDAEMRYRVEVYDETTGARLARSGQRGPSEFVIPAGTGPVILRLSSQEPSLAPRFSAYTVRIGDTE